MASEKYDFIRLRRNTLELATGMIGLRYQLRSDMIAVRPGEALQSARPPQ
jgi:hypothetical protein